MTSSCDTRYHTIIQLFVNAPGKTINPAHCCNYLGVGAVNQRVESLFKLRALYTTSLPSGEDTIQEDSLLECLGLHPGSAPNPSFLLGGIPTGSTQIMVEYLNSHYLVSGFGVAQPQLLKVFGERICSWSCFVFSNTNVLS